MDTSLSPASGRGERSGRDASPPPKADPFVPVPIDGGNTHAIRSCAGVAAAENRGSHYSTARSQWRPGVGGGSTRRCPSGVE